MKPKVKVDIRCLRLLAKNRTLVEQQQFYKPYVEQIEATLGGMSIVELSKMVYHETDACLQELECEALSKQLATYIGPITFDYLDTLMEIFPVSSVWRLATDAKFPLIKEKAREKLNQILDQYGHEMKDKKILEKRKQNERNKK